MKHKHAFVGSDQEGTACIYVLVLDEEGTTQGYLTTQALQKIADRINNMKIGLTATPQGRRT